MSFLILHLQYKSNIIQLTMESKITSLDEVKSLFNTRVENIYIGEGKEGKQIELTPQDAVYKVNHLMNVCTMALRGINDLYGNVGVGELHKDAYADLDDIIECLSLANGLLPHGAMEFFRKLDEEL